MLLVHSCRLQCLLVLNSCRLQCLPVLNSCILQCLLVVHRCRLQCLLVVHSCILQCLLVVHTCRLQCLLVVHSCRLQCLLVVHSYRCKTKRNFSGVTTIPSAVWRRGCCCVRDLFLSTDFDHKFTSSYITPYKNIVCPAPSLPQNLKVLIQQVTFIKLSFIP